MKKVQISLDSLESLKEALIYTVLITVAFVTVICIRFYKFKRDKYVGELVWEHYYSIKGYEGKVYKDRLVVYDGDLKIINLYSKTVIKDIEIPGKTVLGFDIYENKVFWADTRNAQVIANSEGDLEKVNSDIFMYDLKTDEITQITTNKGAQIKPTAWGDYIAWQDNRNDELKDGYPKWDIYLYNMKSKEEIRITKTRGIHTNCNLNENILVWEDGRNYFGLQSIRLESEVPVNNTDIYMYDIKKDRYLSIAHGRDRQAHPKKWGKYVVWQEMKKLNRQGEIVLMDLETLKARYITADGVNQKKPFISEEVIAWVNERHGLEKFDTLQKNKKGGSDIGVYDLVKGKEIIIEEEGAQSLCSLNSSYIVYSSKINEEDSEIRVIKYGRRD
ncbi:MAG: hypothetical protein GX206_10760 [Clostridiales bacterium]|nr:hypothetical protein [Clostridiales bacterium]